MTKAEAIAKVLEENGGSATLSQIYDEIGRHHAGATRSTEWKAGIRGTLYREIRRGRVFRKIGAGESVRYALLDGQISARPARRQSPSQEAFQEAA